MSKSRSGRLVLATLVLTLAGGLSVPVAAASVPSDQLDGAGFAATAGPIRSLAVEDSAIGGAVSDSATGEVAPHSTAPLPACKFRDQLTRFHEVRHWRKTLVDTNLRLKRRYVPWDLVDVSRAKIKGSGKVRKIVITDLKAMARAARQAGKPLAVRSAYRSYARQGDVFRAEIRIYGRTRALRQAARPGHSEHQMGTTIDFMSAKSKVAPWLYDFGSSPAGKWIARNGWRYGFVMSYPKNRRKVSCYSYEPWHWRYVGRERAREIHESGKVPRRWLWENYESVP